MSAPETPQETARREQIEHEAREDAQRATSTEALTALLTDAERAHLAEDLGVWESASRYTGRWSIPMSVPGNDSPDRGQDEKFIAGLRSDLGEARRLRGEAARFACRAFSNGGFSDGRTAYLWVYTVHQHDHHVSEGERLLADGLRWISERPARVAAAVEASMSTSDRVARLEARLAAPKGA